MNKFRALLVVSVAALAAACSSTPTKPAAPTAPAKPAAPVAPAAANLAGVWTVTIDSPQGSQDSKLTLQQTGSNLTGTLESPMGSVAITGKVDGAAVTMSFSIDLQGNSLKIDFIGTQDNGTTMKGRAVFGTFGEGTFTAKRGA